MGGPAYSAINHSRTIQNKGYLTKSVQETFTQNAVHHEMSPNGVNIRESRDSDEHPISTAIIIGLDVTGSMGYIPHQLIKEGLPHLMNRLYQAGVPDPQVMFVAVGDHLCDSTPLQVAQFETNDELLDKWLELVYLEGGGGGNGGESYMLAWYFAGYHTSIDCWEKRKQKGFLFTIGDEHNHKTVSHESLRRIMGNASGETAFTSTELLAKAQESYNVYHIHVIETYNGSVQAIQDGWRETLGSNLLVANNSKEIADMMAKEIVSGLKPEEVKSSTPDLTIIDEATPIEEEML